MKIILTGALGHIGSRLIRELPLQFDNLELIMVDDLSTQRYCSLFNLDNNSASYHFIESKVEDIEWRSLLKGAYVVIHLAALTDAAGTADKAELVYKNNFNSTKIVADACLEADVPFIFPSSTSIYGSQDEIVDENCINLYPQSPYAGCKIDEETYIKSLFEKNLPGIICRLGTIYGTSPGMRFHTAVNKFCWQAIMGQPLTVWETAMDQKRPYLDLLDCCNAIIWIIKSNIFNREVYNIVSDNFTVRNVLDEIQKTVSNLNIKLVQHKIMNQLSYKVSSAKFRNTGFVFNGSLSSGIEETILLLQKSNN